MKWSNEKVQQLHDLAFAGKSNKEIADALHVALTDVYAKRSQLGITRAKVAAAKGEDPEPAVTQQSNRAEKICAELTAAPESVDINHLEDLLDGIVQAMPDPAGVTKCAIELRRALEGIRRAAWTGSQP